MPNWVPDTTGRFQLRPEYTKSEIETIFANDVSRFLNQKYSGTGNGRIETDDLIVLIESNVQDLDVYADLPDDEHGKVLGETVFTSTGPIVNISERLSTDAKLHHRYRFTLAHEYVHVRLHSPLFAANREPDRAFRVTRSYEEDIVSHDWMEHQANRGGGVVLMPDYALKTAIAKFRTANNLPLTQFHLNEQRDRLVRFISRRFEVSHEAARIRLIQANILANASEWHDTRKPSIGLVHCSHVLQEMGLMDDICA